MSEKALIERMLKQLTHSEDQLNGPFECDAELIRQGDRVLGISIDEFSPEEDMFTLDEPVRLGSNLVAATISDLWAAGVEPAYFIHSVCLSNTENEPFIDEFMAGVNSALQRVGAFLIGGDTGRSQTFRYTGVAFGNVPSGSKPLTRIVPVESQRLWVTGSLGDMNMAALNRQAMPDIEIRQAEAQLIREHGTSCIDTSGGFIDSLWTLSELNPSLRFRVAADRLPVSSRVLQFCAVAGVPVAASLLGGAGEYELLFTTPAELDEEIIRQFEALHITPIGRVEYDIDQAGIWFEIEEFSKKLKSAPPCPRSFTDVDHYIQAVMEQAVAIEPLFGKNDES